MNTSSVYGTVTVRSVFRTLPMILVSIAAFIGNSLVLLAIYRFQNLRTFSNMYIGSLAITDVAASLVMPFSYVTVLTNGRWLFGDAMCTINGFLLTFIASTSMLTLLVFSTYRCYLVTTVQKRIPAVTLGRMVKISVISIWVLAFIYASPPLFGGGKLRFMPNYYSCIIDFSSSKYYAEFLFVCVFTVPLVIMTIAYARIIKFIKMHNKTIKKSSEAARRQRKQSGAFAQSSEASVDEGNRYTVMELKRKLDLMNEAKPNKAQEMLQTQHSDVLSQVKNQQDSQPSQGNTSEEIPLKILKPSDTEVIFNLNSGQNTESISSQQDVANTENIREGEPSNESSSDSKTPETFKKISVGSVVQKWKNRLHNKQDVLKTYRKRVSHQAHLARILLATVVMFIVCWAPFAVDSCLLGAGYTKERPRGFQLVSQWMAFSNALCNPIIYSLLNKRFRVAFKTIIQEYWQLVCTCKQNQDEVFET